MRRKLPAKPSTAQATPPAPSPQPLVALAMSPPAIPQPQQQQQPHPQLATQPIGWAAYPSPWIMVYSKLYCTVECLFNASLLISNAHYYPAY